MSQDAVERLLGRLLTDDVFRQHAVKNVAKACREVGFDLVDAELDAIRPDDIERMGIVARQLDDSIKCVSGSRLPEKL